MLRQERLLPITDTTYDFEEIQDSVMGAGILPVAVHGDELFFALGKERYVSHWRGSLKWSGFEGGRKNEESVEYTAAREFVEESLGVIPFNGRTASIAEIADALRGGEYVLRIVLSIVQSDAGAPQRYHVTYVVQVPYDPRYTEVFQEKREAFLQLVRRTEDLGRCTAQLSPMLPQEGKTFHGHKVAAILRAEPMDSATAVRVEIADDARASHVYEICKVSPDDVSTYCEWFSDRRQCAVDLAALSLHESACDISRNGAGDTAALRMNEDFIEKLCIDWWSVDTLLRVLNNGGYVHNDHFRAYFLPVLQRTLQELLLSQAWRPSSGDGALDAIELGRDDGQEVGVVAAHKATPSDP